MTTPFARGSVSIGLYVHHQLPAAELVREMLDQAILADRVGFDGVTLSEHHAGFPTYLPNPLQAAGWLLDVMPHAWSAALPLLLPLRPAAIVAEEIAWLAARHPGRVGAGFAPGYHADDFALAQAPTENLAARYRADLELVVRALQGRGDDLMLADPAIATCAAAPVPAISAAGSRTAGRRTAELGLGILPVGDVPAVLEAYRQAGGSGPVLLGRHVWLGEPRWEGAAAVRTRYRRGAISDDWSFVKHLKMDPKQAIISGSEDEVATRLLEDARRLGIDGFSLRMHVAAAEPAEVRDQIQRTGEGLLPILRTHLPAASSA